LANQDLERAFRARLCADVAGNTLEGHLKIIRVEHYQLRAVANTTHASNALFLVYTHDSIAVSIDGIGGAHIDALTALVAHMRLVSSVVFDDSDG